MYKRVQTERMIGSLGVNGPDHSRGGFWIGLIRALKGLALCKKTYVVSWMLGQNVVS